MVERERDRVDVEVEDSIQTLFFIYLMFKDFLIEVMTLWAAGSEAVSKVFAYDNGTSAPDTR